MLLASYIIVAICLHLVIAAGETRRTGWWIEQELDRQESYWVQTGFVLGNCPSNSRLTRAKPTVSACLSLLSCNEQEMGHIASSLNLFTAHWVYHYDKYYKFFKLFIIWLNRDLLNGREICVNWSHSMSQFLGCCVGVNVVNYWGSANEL